MKLQQILDHFRSSATAANEYARRVNVSPHYLAIGTAQAIENLEVENERLRERLLDLQKQIDEIKELGIRVTVQNTSIQKSKSQTKMTREEFDLLNQDKAINGI